MGKSHLLISPKSRKPNFTEINLFEIVLQTFLLFNQYYSAQMFTLVGCHPGEIPKIMCKLYSNKRLISSLNGLPDLASSNQTKQLKWEMFHEVPTVTPGEQYLRCGT
jgi:hypothetical protein